MIVRGILPPDICTEKAGLIVPVLTARIDDCYKKFGLYHISQVRVNLDTADLLMEDYIAWIYLESVSNQGRWPLKTYLVTIAGFTEHDIFSAVHEIENIERW